MIDAVPDTFFLVFAIAFGAIVGSFLNVLIYRLPLGKSVVWPASACTACARELAWYENVPVVSYLALRGRCRTCASRISIRYPLVELFTAAMFGLAWWQYGPSVLLASRLVLACLLIVLFATDLEHHLLPNVLTLPGAVIGVVFSLFAPPGWMDSLIGLAAGGGVLYLTALAYFWVRHEEGLGMGDPKMLAMIGAFLGWKMTLLTLMLASLAGSAIGLGLILAGRGTMKYALPFGCFLAIGAAAAATVGPALAHWYFGLL
jgi:leader peptidase (prepilin peptidase)/N-methyltransferase